MKKTILFTALLAILGVAPALFSQTASAPAAPLKVLRIGVVNFKNCVENAKVGKQEQANFEGLKKQMESVLAEKEKTLNDLSAKMNDGDYLDTLSAEAETDMKRKFRALAQEITQQQQEYMQVLQQTNFKVLQKLNDLVVKAAATVSKTEKLDIVLNEEGTFYYASDLDISPKVIAILDADFDKQPPAEPAKNAAIPAKG